MFDASRNRLYVATYDVNTGHGFIEIRDGSTNQVIGTLNHLPADANQFVDIAIDADGQRVVVTNANFNGDWIQVYDAVSGNLLETLDPPDPVGAVTNCPTCRRTLVNGGIIYLAGEDGHLYLIDLNLPTGSPNRVQSLSAPVGTAEIALNASTRYLYVLAGLDSIRVVAIDVDQTRTTFGQSTTLITGGSRMFYVNIAVDAHRSEVYVPIWHPAAGTSSGLAGTIAILDGDPDHGTFHQQVGVLSLVHQPNIPFLDDSYLPWALAINAVTGRLYVLAGDFFRWARMPAPQP